MRLYAGTTVAPVAPGEVDTANQEFRITRPRLDKETLKRSIARFGVLEPPVFLKKGGGLVILLGHNRVEACLGIGVPAIPAVVTDAVDPEAYLEYALVKSFRNEMGPVGKIRCTAVAARMAGFDEKRLIETARHGFGLSDDFAGRPELRAMAEALPGALRGYLDLRDISFKTLRNILYLPPPGWEFLARWVEAVNLRVNVFREVVDMMVDVYRRDGGIEGMPAPPGSAVEDRHGEEGRLYGETYRLRYPDYSRRKEAADRLVESFRKERIEVGVPPFFDGDGVNITVKVRRGDDLAKIRERLGSVDMARIRELLDLL